MPPFNQSCPHITKLSIIKDRDCTFLNSKMIHSSAADMQPRIFTMELINHLLNLISLIQTCWMRFTDLGAAELDHDSLHGAKSATTSLKSNSTSTNRVGAGFKMQKKKKNHIEHLKCYVLYHINIINKDILMICMFTTNVRSVLSL